MVEPTLANFRIYFPEFAPVADAVVLLYLDDATGDFSRSLWGRCYGKSVLWYAAHELALSLARVASVGADGVVPQTGILQAGSEEGISFSFARTAPANAQDEWLGQTPYGLAWAAMRRSCLTRASLSW